MVTITEDDLVLYGGGLGIAVLAYLALEYLQKQKTVSIGAAGVSSAPIRKECGD